MRRSLLRPAEVCGPHNIDLSPQPERSTPYLLVEYECFCLVLLRLLPVKYRDIRFLEKIVRKAQSTTHILSPIFCF